MDHIFFGTKRIDYVVKRNSRRKTLAINITPASQVIVLAPNHLSPEKIKTIVKKKVRWILEKQEYFSCSSLRFSEKEFISGEQVLLLGRKYRLKIKKAQERHSGIPELIGRRIFMFVNLDFDADEKRDIIKDALIKWYFALAIKIINRRVKRYSRLLDLFPKEVIIKDQKKRWGSCSNNGILRFNWRIVMAPISIVDYVIVHEMCHLRIKNHSSDFWRIVSVALPDYQRRKDWLKNNLGIFSL